MDPKDYTRPRTSGPERESGPRRVIGPLSALADRAGIDTTIDPEIDITSETFRGVDGFGFEVFINGVSCYRQTDYPNERSRDNALATHRTQARRLAESGAAELRRETTRPYTLAVVAETVELGKHLWDVIGWRLNLHRDDVDVVFTTYGRRLARGTRVDGIVFVHPASAEYAARGTLDGFTENLAPKGWRAFIGGPEPWSNARDLLR